MGRGMRCRDTVVNYCETVVKIDKVRVLPSLLASEVMNMPLIFLLVGLRRF